MADNDVTWLWSASKVLPLPQHCTRAAGQIHRTDISNICKAGREKEHDAEHVITWLLSCYGGHMTPWSQSQDYAETQLAVWLVLQTWERTYPLTRRLAEVMTGARAHGDDGRAGCCRRRHTLVAAKEPAIHVDARYPGKCTAHPLPSGLGWGCNSKGAWTEASNGTLH